MSVAAPRYEIRRKIRDERFGSLHEARDVRLGRALALKSAHEHARDDRRTFAQLAGEAYTLSRLSSDFVPRLYDVFQEEDGRLGLTLEPVGGKTLRDMLTGGASLWSRLIVIRDACSGVEEVHRQGVVHRDLKPCNTDPRDTCRRTQRRLQPRRRPLRAAHGLAAARSGGPPDTTTTTLRKHDSTAFQAVIERALAESAEDRYASAGEMGEALEPLIELARSLPETLVFDVADD